MSLKRAILFSGPPRSGKDLATTLLYGYIRGRPEISAALEKFAAPIKQATHLGLGIPFSCEYYEQEFGNAWKDEPQVEFVGRTPREVYIEFSEKFMKPLFGQDIFGRVAGRRVKQSSANTFLFSDCGFHAEVRALALQIGAENCCLVELHRPDCDYTNDSRSYISDACRKDPALQKMTHYRIDNDRDKDWLRFLLRGIAKDFLGVDE